MEAEQKALCVEVLDEFFKMEASEAFRERVNWEEWGLYDYLQVVKTPMDMTTVRTKLSKGEYKKPEEFAKDMRLIWDNCKLYNQDGSDLWAVAHDLSKMFDERMKELKLDDGPSTKSSSSEPSLEERIVFSQDIYKISSKDLGTVIEMLEERCPKALDRQNADELELNVDAIDTKTFKEVDAFIKDCVPGGALPRTLKKGKRKKDKDGEKSSKRSKE
ncbi:unnamed protein product [Aphanomyces euteiches]|uniref:Bromo domain-containing protein n=1 Tax=Aphanomyces euteiches TaxID=100861 RepID=A0A6G0WNJ5_9STRA|nr:hypothetical protein Ae201684_013461 [Aphanomyces euteiches]KAH9062931.1 hypothetical protein Ae201684P_009197 [Aphanomyces euteiches]KAH9110386.1 hypothetical protein AeMF1_014804 [Aphanomyces euteiches]KAH9130227.1 hypothetical protein LEN26_008724 [Aphanomyces euteiches]KAH9150330.1 hypothetical protein AeRB84_006808 [Aphanomyces euteiches]